MIKHSEENVPAAKCSLWSPNRLVTVIVIVHLGLTFVVAAAMSRFNVYSLDHWSYIPAMLANSGLVGFQIGQLMLLATWCAFAGQSLFLRTIRFLSLAAWLFLLDRLGEYLVVGEIAKVIVEEYAAYKVLQILPSLVILVVWGLCSGRKFVPNSQPQVKGFQFSTRQLFLVTAEAAALLALGRVVLSWNKNAAEEFWNGLTGNRFDELILVVVSVTLLPVIVYGLGRNWSFSRLFALIACLVLASFILACLHGNHPWFAPLSAEEFALQWLDYFWVHSCAAVTILCTFWLLRRIGYDFRRRGEGPEGRNSSKARNSAASASA